MGGIGDFLMGSPKPKGEVKPKPEKKPLATLESLSADLEVINSNQEALFQQNETLIQTITELTLAVATQRTVKPENDNSPNTFKPWAAKETKKETLEVVTPNPSKAVVAGKPERTPEQLQADRDRMQKSRDARTKRIVNKPQAVQA